MISPQILGLFTLVFVALGVYNIYSGTKKLRAARAQGRPTRWYTQINILTGLEYLMLSLVFLVSLNFSVLPPAIRSIVIPFYFVTLALSAVLAFMVIRQGIRNARRPAAATSSSSKAKSNGQVEIESELTPEERAARLERRRKRRQNAAAARRRRTGKA